MGRRCIVSSKKLIYYILKQNVVGEKLYMFEGEDYWITFEKAFIKYPPRKHQWKLLEEQGYQKSTVYR